MIRDHSLHHDHQDERTRLKQHQRELDRERRRLASLVQSEAEYVDGQGRRVANEDIITEGKAW